MTLILKQHPASIREQTKRNGTYKVDLKTFEGILRDFSKMKIDGELGILDIRDLEEDLEKSDPVILTHFIEEAISWPLIHPSLYTNLFRVGKKLYDSGTIQKEKYISLCTKLLNERAEDLEKRHDLSKIKTDLLVLE